MLGDIIHSRPIYVHHATEPRVYVGANDGMLHAFDATTGEEVFAYLPSFFIAPIAAANFSHIKALIVDPYVHNYYVDASPNAQRVKISGVDKTILVGGVGAGGKGLYALDITDPTADSEAAAASKILWEITPTTVNNAANTAYAELGHTYGIPVIAKLNDGTWAAIVGNGYNNTGSEPGGALRHQPHDGRQDRRDHHQRRRDLGQQPQRALQSDGHRHATTTARSTTSTPATSTATCGSSTSGPSPRPSSPSSTRRARRSRSPAGRRWRCTRTAAT